MNYSPAEFDLFKEGFMKTYRIMLGENSIYAHECVAGNFIGTDYGFKLDFSGKLYDDKRKFNKEFIPIYLENRPGKAKVVAGLACGMLWTVSKGIEKGDMVLSPDGEGHYHVAEVTGDYYYQPGEILPHRRPVHWLDQTINRADMSEGLKASTGSIGAVSNITGHNPEIHKLLGMSTTSTSYFSDEPIEDPAAFAMEKHLEDFLVQNWKQTPLGKKYDIFAENGERVGQQYPTDTGNIDILCLSKDRKSLLVIELKKGRASDVVVGQILRYMGYVQEELAEEGQSVKGAIIALEDDQRIRRALIAATNVSFYRYKISFDLVKA